MRVPAAILPVLLMLATCAPADARAYDPSKVLSRARFVGFDPVQLAWITAVVRRAPRPARDAIERVAPFITFRRGADHEISAGDHTSTFVATQSPRFLVSLGTRTRKVRDAMAAHVLMHELGHTVDNALVDERLRAELNLLFSQSPVWSPCYPQPPGSSQRCVPGPEVFAEQFGFYAARDRTPRTLYNVPPLYRFAQFGPLLARAVVGPDTLLERERAG